MCVRAKCLCLYLLVSETDNLSAPVYHQRYVIYSQQTGIFILQPCFRVIFKKLLTPKNLHIFQDIMPYLIPVRHTL